MAATQAPKLDTKTATTAGVQLVTTVDQDTGGFLADPDADAQATLYRVQFRTASGTAFVGGSGHGGGGGDYAELIKITSSEFEMPDLMRRIDLLGLYGYSATTTDLHIRISKVVA
jgi:hypothetical protein